MSGEALVFAVFLIPIGRTAVRRLCNWNRPNIKVLLSPVRVEITKVVELLGALVQTLRNIEIGRLWG